MMMIQVGSLNRNTVGGRRVGQPGLVMDPIIATTQMTSRGQTRPMMTRIYVKWMEIRTIPLRNARSGTVQMCTMFSK